ncbi:MAG TPA: CHASE domain-containing protein [Zeimonas sp.]|nr:CHASE domain-containing protein [Zeimonas sp.]
MTDQTGEPTAFASARAGRLVAWLALGVGLLLTAAIWDAETDRRSARRDALLLERANTLASQIRQRLVAYEVALRGGASLFAATSNPSRAQWRAYVNSLALDTDYPGVQGVAFAAWLAPDQLSFLEESVRAEGFSDFRVWPRGPRPGASAIVYIEPLDAANIRALGYDMFSDETRREAMQTARDSGKAVLTRPVALVQDAGGPSRPAVLLYVPLYRHGTRTDTEEARRDALLGWIYAPFRPGDLMLRLDRGRDPLLAIRLFDGGSGEPVLLYSDAAVRFEYAAGMKPLRVPIDFAGRQWHLDALPSANAAAALDYYRQPWEHLAVGLLISTLLFGLVWAMATTRNRAYALARTMTDALRRTNEQLDQRVAERTWELESANSQLREQVAERARAEAARSAALEKEERRSAQLRSLAEAGVGIGLLPDTSSRLDYLAEHACRLVGAAYALTAVAGDGGRQLALTALAPANAEQRRDLLVAARRWPAPEEAGLLADPWMRADPGTDAAPAPEVLAMPVRLAQGRLIATLYLVQAPGHAFSPEDRAIVRQLMLLAAAAIATSESAEDERRARLDAEAANASKDQFLAIVSHELRTPLQAILGWLAVIERGGDVGPNLQRALGVIRRNAESQSHLIDDLLDLARIEQGKLEIDRKPVDLGSIVAAACESQAQEATERKVTLQCQAAPEAMVRGDPLRLQQVVANLLGNALKFTPAGGRVTITLRRDGDVHVLDVVDTGKGIAPGKLDHVFERFSQDDSSGKRRYGGLGLGLAVVRHIVELHHGHVSASSEGEGRGATFTVRLPALDRDGLRRAQGVVAIPGSGGADAVMIVDDSGEAGSDLTRLLQDEGYAVLSFDDADSAFQWLAGYPPARWPLAALCRVDAPASAGWAFLDELRTLDCRPGSTRTAMPVIALATEPSMEHEARALAHGFDAYVPSARQRELVPALLRDAASCRTA